MTFPFRISFAKTIQIKKQASIDDILAFVQDFITEASQKAAHNFVIANNGLSFEVNFWKTGRANDFDGVSKATFCIYNENEALSLYYDYQIGGGVIFFPILWGIICLLIILFDQRITTGFPRAFIAFILICSIPFLLIWSANLFKQNRLFREIVKKIKSKYNPDDYQP